MTKKVLVLVHYFSYLFWVKIFVNVNPIWPLTTKYCKYPDHSEILRDLGVIGKLCITANISLDGE